MKKTLIVSTFFLFLLTFCTQQDVVKNQPKELLYVWLHDVGFEDPNFLAVINADSESENYGELVDTIPVFELAITPSPILTLLLTPTCPARITPSPICAPPAIPT